MPGEGRVTRPGASGHLASTPLGRDLLRAGQVGVDDRWLASSASPPSLALCRSPSACCCEVASPELGAETSGPLRGKSLNEVMCPVRRCASMGIEGEPQDLRPWPAAAAQDAPGGALLRSGSREATPAAPPANSATLSEPPGGFLAERGAELEELSSGYAPTRDPIQMSPALPRKQVTTVSALSSGSNAIWPTQPRPSSEQQPHSSQHRPSPSSPVASNVACLRPASWRLLPGLSSRSGITATISGCANNSAHRSTRVRAQSTDTRHPSATCERPARRHRG